MRVDVSRLFWDGSASEKDSRIRRMYIHPYTLSTIVHDVDPICLTRRGSYLLDMELLEGPAVPHV